MQIKRMPIALMLPQKTTGGVARPQTPPTPVPGPDPFFARLPKSGNGVMITTCAHEGLPVPLRNALQSTIPAGTIHHQFYSLYLPAPIFREVGLPLAKLSMLPRQHKILSSVDPTAWAKSRLEPITSKQN